MPHNRYFVFTDIVADLGPGENETAVNIKQFTFIPIHMNESISVLSIDNPVLVVSNDTDSQTASCCLVFLGADAEPVLTTNMVRYNNNLFVIVASNFNNAATNLHG